MIIINKANISDINEGKEEKITEKITQTKLINKLLLTNQQNKMFNMQLAKTLAKINMQLAKMEEK